MKTEDLIQLALLGAIGYMAYQKWGVKKPSTTPTTSSTPFIPPLNFGLKDASTWDDTPTPPPMGFVDMLINQAMAV